MLFVGGAGCGHGTAVACVAAPGGAGAVVAGAEGGGRVSVARRSGSLVLFVGGGGRGHGTAVARVVAFGGAGASVAGEEEGEGMASNCTAQNKPKRFKQSYFSVTATQARASTFLSDL